MLATILVAAAMAIVIGAIVWKMIRDRKSGASSCGCGCDGCPSSGSCRPDKH
ncbi:MAG: FeoB-associated Cys-rich membrane protein [Clostridiales bacterium]|jgi:hypothetical protein|nr:FeoB-associated Cys-rich membrane protein [Clostridiales bacterium]OPZ69100.1 MAG: Virus attachment protein p12 family protein [Firmicutes bacterium ADurb.Bin467]